MPSAHSMISRNSANDLEKTYPFIATRQYVCDVVWCRPEFCAPRRYDDIIAFRQLATDWTRKPMS